MVCVDPRGSICLELISLSCLGNGSVFKWKSLQTWTGVAGVVWEDHRREQLCGCCQSYLCPQASTRASVGVRVRRGRLDCCSSSRSCGCLEDLDAVAVTAGLL